MELSAFEWLFEQPTRFHPMPRETRFSHGFRPLFRVKPERFADETIREGWRRDKGMEVFQLWSDRHVETPIDIFVYEPFGFDEEYANALLKPLYNSIEVRFVSIPTLIKMKEAAGREQDKIDIEHLRMRLEDRGGE